MASLYCVFPTAPTRLLPTIRIIDSLFAVLVSHVVQDNNVVGSLRFANKFEIRRTQTALTSALPCGRCVGALGCEADAWPLAGPGTAAGSDLVGRQLLCYRSEQLRDVLGGLGGGLKEEEAGLLGVSLSVGGGDGALVGLLSDEIELVAGKGDDNVFVGLALQFLDPSLGLVERGLGALADQLSLRVEDKG